MSFHIEKTNHWRDQFIGGRVLISDGSKYHGHIGTIIKGEASGYVVNVGRDIYFVNEYRCSFL